MAEDYNSTTQRGPDSPSKKIVGNRRTFADIVGEDDDGGADATATGLSHPSGVKHSNREGEEGAISGHPRWKITAMPRPVSLSDQREGQRVDDLYSQARGSTQPAVLNPSAASPPEVSVGAGSSSLSLPVISQVDEIDKAKIDPAHPLYWNYGVQAGGFLFPFKKYKGRPLREAPRVLLKWAQDETLDSKQAHSLLLTKIGQTLLFPFRRGRYTRQPLARCDARWRRFILRWAKSSTTLGLRYEVFLAAVRASLGLPPRPDFPEPEPVIVNDPQFAPPKVVLPQKNKLDPYLVPKDNTAGPSQPRTQHCPSSIVPRDFSQANAPALLQQSASCSPSPSGSDSYAGTVKTAKGKGKAPARRRHKATSLTVAIDLTQAEGLPAVDAAPAPTPTPTSQQPKVKAKGKRKPNLKIPCQKNTLENHFGVGAKSSKSRLGDSASDPIVIDIDTSSVEVNDAGTASSSAASAGESAAGSSTSRSPRMGRKRTVSEHSRDSGESEEDVESRRPAKRLRRSPRLAESSRRRL